MQTMTTRAMSSGTLAKVHPFHHSLRVFSHPMSFNLGRGIDKVTQKSYKGTEQVGDQKFEGPNLALKLNQSYRMPVRVVRGHGLNSKYAPIEGYRYDGLYDVVEAKLEKGKEGFMMCRYKLVRFDTAGYEIPIQSDTRRATHMTTPNTAPIPSAPPRNYIISRGASTDREPQRRRKRASSAAPYPLYTAERKQVITGHRKLAGLPPITKKKRVASRKLFIIFAV
ncbi:hypothetical protein HGRIS_000520 [Hohenbuehelia grisea]|uniref:YDG domain-containing protein n=1 Tax=Hohenbuehelia grisea TaxID=104357 RepID=A0ABR3JT83_9AGAR